MIQDNPGRIYNGPGGGARHYASEIDAIVAALELDATNIDYDAGLLQINRRNFARHGLTLRIGGAFNPCRSMRAGSDHLTDDFRAVWSLASRRYNCGRIDCGAAYAQHVDTLVAQSSAADPGTPAPPAEPFSPPKPPPLRDALHAPDSGGLIDLLAGQHPQKPAPATIHENKDSNEDAH
jgi:Transglycosylase SLT domain